MEYFLIIDCDLVGYSLDSWRAFLTEMKDRHGHEIGLLAIPVDNIVTNLFLVDKNDREIVFLGSGYRYDLGGEGGAAFKSVISTLKRIGGKISFAKGARITYKDICESDELQLLEILSKYLNDLAYFTVNSEEIDPNSHYRYDRDVEEYLKEVIVLI